MRQLYLRYGASRVRLTVGVALLIAFCIECWPIGEPQASATALPLVQPAVAAIKTDAGDPYEKLAETAPLSLLEKGLQRCQRSVRDYTVTLTKQERIGGKLRPEQQIEVKFKYEPFSVLMHWVRNPDKARRVIYVQGRRVDEQGRELALAEPEGAIARLLVPSITLPINGSEAQATSRRTIDQFGFENALTLVIKYCRLARTESGFDLRYIGDGTVGDRETYVLERVLPYTGENNTYPDRRLVVHLDKQWLIPLSTHCYADDARKELLASYVFTDVRLNVGLTDKDFTPEANGL